MQKRNLLDLKQEVKAEIQVLASSLQLAQNIISKFNFGLGGVKVSLDSKPNVAKTVVTITWNPSDAVESAEAEGFANGMQNGGWACSSTGEGSASCESPN